MRILNLTFFLIFICSFGFTQTFSQVEFQIDSIPKQGVLLDKGWKWHVGDNPDFAKADFDDSAWEEIDPALEIPKLPQINTDKPLWLRLNLSCKNDNTFFASVIQSGATEIFLNGKLISTNGQIENASKSTVAYDPLNDAFILHLDSNNNTLAVRYYFQKNINYNSVYNINFPLFSLHINNRNHPTNIYLYFWSGFNIAVPFLLFIVHFIFFLIYTPNRTNFWYSLASFWGFIGSFLLFKMNLTHSLESKNYFSTYASIPLLFSNILIYYTVYLFLKQRTIWMVISFAGLSILALTLNYFDYFQSSVFFNYLITVMYAITVMYMGNRAWKQGEKGGLYLIFGMIAYIFFWTLFILSFNFGWESLSGDILFHIATLIIPIIVSVLLGLEFKNINNSLIQNLQEVNKLSTEKQQILATQNETLEKQVAERTAELKASQNQLIQSEKLASLGELTAGIAHEIQNPLNFVNNFSELSGELIDEMNEEIEKGDTEEVKAIAGDLKQNLEKINHHGKRASSIVKGMLEHSRTSTGVKELTDINALADEYLRLSYHGLRAKDSTFNANFKTDFDENLPKIAVIPQDFGRVLLNLINNAFYAVTSVAERSRSHLPLVIISTRWLSEVETIEVSVQDNGTGMSEATKAKIFQPFFTTKPTGQGTGLGLSLAYDIITKGHGGTLEVETKEGEGTTFVINLPIQ